MMVRSVSMALALAAVFASVDAADSHVVLSQTTFEAGVNFAAFFKVEHGCDGSPTLSLRVEIPQAVSVVELPAKEGWTTNTERSGDRISAVSWRGRLEGGEHDQFPVLLKLPAHTGPVYFPTIQHCAKGEMRWTEIPAPGDSAKLTRPAPVVLLTEPKSHPAMYMAGDIMVMEAWSRATPPGAQTGAGYLTIMNHGTKPDVLLGGKTDVAARLEIHQTSIANGIVSMRPAVDGVLIPAGGSISFKPQAGFHMMLVGLKAPLKAGTPMSATLNFKNAGPLAVEFSVEPIGAPGPSIMSEEHR